MQVTEVRIKLMDEHQQSNERLLAFCSITFDDAFVVRDLKIIEGTKGSFVAMPSRRLTDRCRGCNAKNPLRSRYCSNCGQRLDENRAPRDPDGRPRLHADIAHPINADCREMIQQAVLREYAAEKQRAQQPGYVCRYDHDDYEAAEPQSYAGVISRLDGPGKRGRTRHQPTHTQEQQTGNGANGKIGQPTAAPRAQRPSNRQFGEGIL